MPPIASSHLVWGAALHEGQRTFKASVSMMLAVVIPTLLMWQGVWSDHSCTISKQNAAPSPDSVIQQGTRIAVSPDILTGGDHAGHRTVGINRPEDDEQQHSGGGYLGSGSRMSAAPRTNLLSRSSASFLLSSRARSLKILTFLNTSSNGFRCA
jgi:hypothetical protein